MATAQEVIKNFMKSLDETSLSGESAVDEAIQACSNFNSISDAISQMVSDCKKASSATSFLTDYCGIILDNEDTGAITGSDAGGSTVKTAESIVPEVGSLSTYTNNSFTTNGLNVQLVTFSDDDYENHYESTTYSSLTDTQKHIWNALYTWWIPNTLNLISESYGSNFSFTSNSSATIKTLHAGFVETNSSMLALVTNWSDGQTVADLDLKTNMYYYNDIDTSDPNGSTSTTSYYLDRTLAHEMTHAVMAANVDYFSYLPLFIKEGMAELTHGIDDTRRTRILTLAGSADSLESALDVSNTSTATNPNPYAAGYMFLRYLAKQASDSDEDTLTWKISGTTATYGTSSETLITLKGLKSGLTVSDGEIDGITLKNNTVTLATSVLGDDGASVSGGDYRFVLGGAGKLTNYGTATTLKGSSENDTLVGGTSADSLSGGRGNDYLNGGRGDDSILGGAGADTLIGSYGADYMNGGYGDDSILGGAGADTLIGSYGADYINGGYGDDSILGGAGADTLIGSYGADYLSGGAGDDSLRGGNGMDTLYGGTGNDTLTGGKHRDVFVYSKSTGNDIITDYTAGIDKIKISSGTITETTISDDDLIFTIGKGTLTIQNGANKKITVIDSADNETTQIYSTGSSLFNENLAELWFVEENSVGEFEFSSSEKNIKRYDLAFAGE